MAGKIDVRNLDFCYGQAHVLRDINVTIHEHEITALIGPSGCGKSTFLRTLNRMNDLIPGARATGQVLVDGEDILSPNADVVELRRRVGMVFQRPNPFPTSIFDNVAFGPRVQERDREVNLRSLVEQSLRGAALWDEVYDKLDRSALDLALGQQQRLCIARTLASGSEIILMDEPASALDPVATLAVEDLMHALKPNYTIVVVTHNMQQAARIADRAAFFLMGELVEYGTHAEVFSTPKDKRTEDYITGRFG
ncbi:MAG: phosphate ABC transporter ATP-binding protein PstB [Dehalococcoidales bacterium]|nr:phosphate ABC transporter ATP-binding protein PstB [Dehalococcoidales bacterium]